MMKTVASDDDDDDDDDDDGFEPIQSSIVATSVQREEQITVFIGNALFRTQ